jgi:hypothetical protein
MKRFYLLLISTVLISACNTAQGGPVPTNTGEARSPATVAATVKPATARPAGPTAVPTPLPKVTPLAVNVGNVPVGGFQISVTGTVTANLAGTAAFFDSAGSGSMLSLSSAAAGNTPKIVTLVVPDNLAPGSYPILPYLSNAKPNGDVIGVGANYTEFTNGAPVYASISGTLTVKSINPYTGAFTFKAASGTKQIALTGVFNQVARKKS